MATERKVLGTRNGLKIYKRLVAKKKLITKKPINQMSNGKYKQVKAEQKLKKELVEKCGGLCENCHQPPDFRGLSKHEKVFRSHGGNPLDKNNVEILCGRCHSLRHGVIET